MNDNKNKLILEFLGERVKYDSMGQFIVGPDAGQYIADIRGWGALQNKFKGDPMWQEKAAALQDAIGEFIAEAVNEKIQRVKEEQQ